MNSSSVTIFLTQPDSDATRLMLAHKLGGQQATTVLAHVPIQHQISAYGNVVNNQFGAKGTLRQLDVSSSSGYDQARKLLADGAFDNNEQNAIGQSFIAALREAQPGVKIPQAWISDPGKAFAYVSLMAQSHGVQN